MYRKGTYLKRKDGVREDIPIIIKIIGNAGANIPEIISDILYINELHYEIKDSEGRTNYFWGRFLKEHYDKVSKEEAFVYVI
jgi:hypothetical protein